MTQTESAYSELVERVRQGRLLAACMGLLSWDERTYMPRAGGPLRGEQMALLAQLYHERLADPRLGELLAQLADAPLGEPEQACVREVRRVHHRAVKIPKRLVEELARTTTLAQGVWVEARAKSDYSLFLPHLQTIVRLKREEAQAVGYDQSPYDALLDEYEPGATVAQLQPIFAGLADALVPLIAAIANSTVRPDRSIIEREYPVDRQRFFAESAAAAVGFRFDAGRLDVSAHPFCSGLGPGDCRLTTRYHPHRFNDGFFGMLHEVGHGLYEQNLDPQHFGTPLGEAVSLGIHESQSRLWENQVGRSEPFWRHFFPRARQAFPEALAEVGHEAFYLAINEVTPSFIRVEADEATYNLHIILRFELEQALLADQLQPADLPLAWNERFQQLLGLSPPDDARGCLQDIHWSSGGLGYFPTYTLGNLYAAQFMAQARRDLPGLDEAFARGDFAPLRQWLTHSIHRHGSLYRPDELCRRVTGQPLDPSVFVTYLRDKLAPLYRL
jgi:carboxypeptidase Taq